MTWKEGEGSELHDARGLQPLGTLGHLELDLLPFGQGLEALPLNRRVVDEDVLPVFLFDEPVALRVAEPLELTRLAHRLPSLPVLLVNTRATNPGQNRRDYKERRFRVSRKIRAEQVRRSSKNQEVSRLDGGLKSGQ